MIEALPSNGLDLLAPLWQELNTLHQGLDEVCGRPRRETTWEQRRTELWQKAKGKHHIRVVRQKDKVVAFCFTSIDDENRGEIDSLFVLPEFRGKGLGKDLVTDALKWLNDSGCKDIHVDVHPCNTNAVRLYWKFGFLTGAEMKKMASQPLETMLQTPVE